MNAHSYTWDLVVVIGTKGPFPRLLEAVRAWARAGDKRVWVQWGEGDGLGLDGASVVERETLLAHMRDAAVVVIHAGTGAIRDALSLGHVPVVVPRRARYGEHVNDHQVEIVQALGDRIIPCPAPEDPAAFAAAVARAGARRGERVALPGAELREALRARMTAVAPAPRAPWVWSVLERLTRGVDLRRR